MVNNSFAMSFPQYCQLKYNTMDVKELTCPIPQCPLPTGGCVQSMGSRARIPWFHAGWIQCSCGTLLCSVPTLSILSHLCLPYISFPHQRTLQHRCVLWRQFLCSVFYDNGEFIALRRDSRTFLFFAKTTGRHGNSSLFRYLLTRSFTFFCFFNQSSKLVGKSNY